MKLLLKNSIWLGVLLLLTVLFSAVVDPGNLLLSGRQMEQMLQILQSGSNLDCVANYPDRLFFSYAAERVSAPDTLVLGSSRTAQIDSAISGDRLWNASVTGATLADSAAMFRCYAEAGSLGQRVVLGLDSWTLNGGRAEPRTALYLAAPYNRFLQSSGLSLPPLRQQNHTLEALRELCSFGYFQSAVAALPQFLAGNRLGALRATDADTTEFGMLRADGSYVYPQSYENSSEPERSARAEQHVESVAGVLQNGAAAEDQLLLFRALCREITAAGCELVLFLCPIHPETYAALQQQGFGDVMQQQEQLLRQIAAEQGAVFVGGYNAEALGLSAADFLDGLHLSYAGTAALLAPVLQGQ